MKATSKAVIDAIKAKLILAVKCAVDDALDGIEDDLPEGVAGELLDSAIKQIRERLGIPDDIGGDAN